jgi:hypothetical protein
MHPLVNFKLDVINSNNNTFIHIGQIGKDCKYIGELKFGKPHGGGIVTWPNGNQYIGEWDNGKPNGPGIFINAQNGHTELMHTLNNGRISNYVISIAPNGEIHGQMYDAAANFLNYNGISFSWMNETNNTTRLTFNNKSANKDSDQLLQYANNPQYQVINIDGGVYVGGYANKTRNGLGVFLHANKNRYMGWWQQGQYHGYGILTYTDGAKYVGEYGGRVCLDQ